MFFCLMLSWGIISLLSVVKGVFKDCRDWGIGGFYKIQLNKYPVKIIPAVTIAT